MDIKKAIEEAARIAAVYIDREQSEPVLPRHSLEEYASKINVSLGKNGCKDSEFFNTLQEVALLTPKTGSPLFFNQLFAGKAAPSLCADMLVPVMNTAMHTFKVSGIQVLIENEITTQLLQKVGYKNGEGIINPGGSMSNMVSMLIARNEKLPTIGAQGLGGQRLIAYTSEKGHYSVQKNAAILGIGRDNVRPVKTDSRGRMESAHLQELIERDLVNGFLPFYVNATAGTTVFGTFDPFEEISAIAKEYDLWFHIDGALGGSALLSERHRHLVKGSSLSDSFTWNAHKMLNVPMTASFLLMKEKGILRKHLDEDAHYLFQNRGDDNDLGQKSIQCGRRVDALKVWAAWKYYGEKGLEKRINHLFDLVRHAREIILSDPAFTLYCEPESVNVCFNVMDIDAPELCSYLHEKSMAMVGYSGRGGHTFVRMACINADLSFDDIDSFFDHVKKAALELSAQKAKIDEFEHA